MKRTPLHDKHIAADGKMVEFGGWMMPVQYGPILEEARHVREAAGLFDLSHMGRLHIRGTDAVRMVDSIATNYCGKIPVGSIRYSLFCRENGYPIDDLLLYREEQDVYAVVNASNTQACIDWIESHMSGFDAQLVDETDTTGMIAVQGPKSLDVMSRIVTGAEIAKLGYYKFTFATFLDLPDLRISRTGYTGENGFEIYFPIEHAEEVWDRTLAAGEPEGLRPIGLGARDVLRLEAGMPLYGHELDAEHQPLEAGLAFAVSFSEDKGDYVGRTALQQFKENPKRKLVGVTSDGKRSPRQGTEIFSGDKLVGQVTSGSPSPTLDSNIGQAYVDLGFEEAGTQLELDFRGKRQACTVVELPFYSRTRK
jgi:aminomethyltransferase